MIKNNQQEQRKPILLSPRELTEKIARLSQILEFENELLALKSPQSLTENQAEKSRLVGIYNQQMTLLKTNPSEYQKFPKQDIDSLKDVSQKFYETLDEHFRKLSTVKTVTEGIVKAVADEVAKKNAPPKTYNSAAGLQSTPTTRNNSALGGSISFNEVV